MIVDTSRPWRGLFTATALPLNDDLSVDYESYADHVAWLAASGTDGVCPNGSLGEYQTLSDEERARVVETAAAARPEGFGLMPGVGAYGSRQTVRWIEQAAQAGAESVLLLPPNTYRADREAVLNHYRAAAAVGLPIVAYNNPIDTKVDLTPDVLTQLFEEGLIVAVKEFTGDVRRAWEIAELAPGLDVLIGSDDVVVELGIAGAVGWIGGYSNALPQTCAELLAAATSGDPSDLAKALPIYRDLHPLLRWDAKTEFVQAIKLSMDVAGRKGGICRPPRGPLTEAVRQQVTKVTEAAIGRGYK
jgi:1-pyrroline-4-hydroxy-2-carboxylate deaminase